MSNNGKGAYDPTIVSATAIKYAATGCTRWAPYLVL